MSFLFKIRFFMFFLFHLTEFDGDVGFMWIYKICVNQSEFSNKTFYYFVSIKNNVSSYINKSQCAEWIYSFFLFILLNQKLHGL